MQFLSNLFCCGNNCYPEYKEDPYEKVETTLSPKLQESSNASYLKIKNHIPETIFKEKVLKAQEQIEKNFIGIIKSRRYSMIFTADRQAFIHLKIQVSKGSYKTAKLCVRIFEETATLSIKLTSKGSEGRDVALNETAALRRFTPIPNCKIAKLYHAQDFPEKQKHHMYQEYAGDRLLVDAIIYRTLSKEDKFHICNDLFTAVMQVQSTGTVHADIKPDNIMIERKEDRIHAKMIDLGLAYSIHEGPINWGGSMDWSAPEIVRQRPVTRDKVDLFTLGMVFYALKFASNPLQDRFLDQRDKVIRTLSYELSNHSDPLNVLIGKLIKLNPEERISIESAKLFIHAISPENF